jgi:formate hydrogenlyase subunit 6/NADH:ubiquinone oxidoreductase subunit I
MMKELLCSFFKKAATTNYPAGARAMCKDFRGKLKFYPEKCIGCKMCMRDCPSGAINIVKIGDKRFECQIDCSKCIYCAQCVDTCPKDALEATKEFELASLDKATLKIVYHAPPAAPPSTPAEPEPAKKA